MKEEEGSSIPSRRIPINKFGKNEGNGKLPFEQ